MSYPMDRPLPRGAGQWNGIPEEDPEHVEGCILDADHDEPCLLAADLVEPVEWLGEAS